MKQGVPLSRVAYGIVVLLLIKQLKSEYPEITHPCYTYYAGALGMFDKIGLYFNLLKQFGPGSGYYPEPLRSVIFVHLDNLATGK